MANKKKIGINLSDALIKVVVDAESDGETWVRNCLETWRKCHDKHSRNMVRHYIKRLRISRGFCEAMSEAGFTTLMKHFKM